MIACFQQVHCQLQNCHCNQTLQKEKERIEKREGWQLRELGGDEGREKGVIGGRVSLHFANYVIIISSR